MMLEAKKKRLGLIGRGILQVTLWLSVLSIVLLMVLIIYAVFCRYVLQAPSRWISDFVTSYLLAAMTFLPAGWILTLDGHVRVGVVVDRLQAGRRLVIGVITDILGLFYSAVLVRYGWSLTYRDFTFGVTFPTDVPFPTWPAKGLIFIGGAILCVVFVLRIGGQLRRGSDSKDVREHEGG
jgi:TRAP-type C4-dicarboxylate transport system permease small subunit